MEEVDILQQLNMDENLLLVYIIPEDAGSIFIGHPIHRPFVQKMLEPLPDATQSAQNSEARRNKDNISRNL